MAQQSLGTVKTKISRQYHNLADSSFNHVTDNFIGTSISHNNSTDAADVGTLTIPAGRLNAGTIIRVTSFGTVIDNNSTDTLTPILNLTHGSTTVALATGAALDVADNDIVSAESVIHILTTGAAGTFVATSKITTNTGDTVVRSVNTSTAIDTTVATVIALNADWSAANADNEYTHLSHTAQVFG
jgi:hypothetical protein